MKLINTLKYIYIYIDIIWISFKKNIIIGSIKGSQEIMFVRSFVLLQLEFKFYHNLKKKKKIGFKFSFFLIIELSKIK